MGVMTVRQARNMAGKSQSEVATALGICLQTYRKLEANPEKMTIAQAKLFCRTVAQPVNLISFGLDSSLTRESSSA